MRLRELEKSGGTDKALLLTRSKAVAALKALDDSLDSSIDGGLKSIGLPGIKDYEKRYAALSRVEENLKSISTKAQQQQFGDRLKEYFFAGRSGLHGGISGGLPGGGIGSNVEKGFKALGRSDVAVPKGGVPVDEITGLPVGLHTPARPQVRTDPFSDPTLFTSSGPGTAPPPMQVDADGNPIYAREMPNPKGKLRNGMTVEEYHRDKEAYDRWMRESRIGPEGEGGTRSSVGGPETQKVKGLLPPPKAEPVPAHARQVGTLPKAGFPAVQTMPNPSKYDLWGGEGTKISTSEGMGAPTAGETTEAQARAKAAPGAPERMYGPAAKSQNVVGPGTYTGKPEPTIKGPSAAPGKGESADNFAQMEFKRLGIRGKANEQVTKLLSTDEYRSMSNADKRKAIRDALQR
jgi:hypothetical protein